jgi:hypothetical protein
MNLDERNRFREFKCKGLKLPGQGECTVGTSRPESKAFAFLIIDEKTEWTKGVSDITEDISEVRGQSTDSSLGRRMLGAITIARLSTLMRFSFSYADVLLRS